MGVAKGRHRGAATPLIPLGEASPPSPFGSGLAHLMVMVREVVCFCARRRAFCPLVRITIIRRGRAALGSLNRILRVPT